MNISEVKSDCESRLRSIFELLKNHLSQVEVNTRVVRYERRLVEVNKAKWEVNMRKGRDQKKQS